MSVTPDKRCDLKAGQHSDQNGPFEVLWLRSRIVDGSPLPGGWYWWSCSPGCLPDGEAQGPYNTSTEAWQAATNLDMGHDLPGGPTGTEEFGDPGPDYDEPAKYGNT